jgi:DNA-binding IclR family transcriptional regulator
VPERGVRVFVVPGEVMPAHAAASAKAIMAFQPPEFVDAVLSAKLEKFTPATKTSPLEIRREYAQVREQNYAVCWDELEVGLAAVACPIELPDAGVIYALGVSGIGERISRRSIEAVRDELASVLPDVERALRQLSGTSKARHTRSRRPEPDPLKRSA